MRTIAITTGVALCFILAACEAKKPAAPKVVPSETNRADTAGLEAASAVGYDGKAIRARVDNVLNKADELNKQAVDETK